MSAKEAATGVSINKTPGVIGGSACIGLRRIAVWMLVDARREGFTDEELLERYEPPLTREELAAAWRYAEEHPEEIETDIRENEED